MLLYTRHINEIVALVQRKGTPNSGPIDPKSTYTSSNPDIVLAIIITSIVFLIILARYNKNK